MATTTVNPEIKPQEAKKAPVMLTPTAIAKVREIMAQHMEGLKVYVDATSLTYLNGCTVDYIETLEGAGFKFDNPQVKSTCGCGSSFSV